MKRGVISPSSKIKIEEKKENVTWKTKRKKDTTNKVKLCG